MSDNASATKTPTTTDDWENLRTEYKETLTNVRTIQTVLWAACGVWLAVQGFAIVTITATAAAPILKLAVFVFALIVDGGAIVNAYLWLKAFGRIRERLEYLTNTLGMSVEALNCMRVPNSGGIVVGIVVFAAVFFGLGWLYLSMGTRSAQESRQECGCLKRQHQEYRGNREHGQGKHHDWRMPDREFRRENDREDDSD